MKRNHKIQIEKQQTTLLIESIAKKLQLREIKLFLGKMCIIKKLDRLFSEKRNFLMNFLKDMSKKDRITKNMRVELIKKIMLNKNKQENFYLLKYMKIFKDKLNTEYLLTLKSILYFKKLKLNRYHINNIQKKRFLKSILIKNDSYNILFKKSAFNKMLSNCKRIKILEHTCFIQQQWKAYLIRKIVKKKIALGPIKKMFKSFILQKIIKSMLIFVKLKIGFNNITNDRKENISDQTYDYSESKIKKDNKLKVLPNFNNDKILIYDNNQETYESLEIKRVFNNLLNTSRSYHKEEKISSSLIRLILRREYKSKQEIINKIKNEDLKTNNSYEIYCEGGDDDLLIDQKSFKNEIKNQLKTSININESKENKSSMEQLKPFLNYSHEKLKMYFTIWNNISLLYKSKIKLIQFEIRKYLRYLKFKKEYNKHKQLKKITLRKDMLISILDINSLKYGFFRMMKYFNFLNISNKIKIIQKYYRSYIEKKRISERNKLNFKHTIFSFMNKIMKKNLIQQMTDSYYNVNDEKYLINTKKIIFSSFFKKVKQNIYKSKCEKISKFKSIIVMLNQRMIFNDIKNYSNNMSIFMIIMIQSMFRKFVTRKKLSEIRKKQTLSNHLFNFISKIENKSKLLFSLQFIKFKKQVIYCKLEEKKIKENSFVNAFKFLVCIGNSNKNEINNKEAVISLDNDNNHDNYIVYDSENMLTDSNLILNNKPVNSHKNKNVNSFYINNSIQIHKLKNNNISHSINYESEKIAKKDIKFELNKSVIRDMDENREKEIEKDFTKLCFRKSLLKFALHKLVSFSNKLSYLTYSIEKFSEKNILRNNFSKFLKIKMKLAKITNGLKEINEISKYKFLQIKCQFINSLKKYNTIKELQESSLARLISKYIPIKHLFMKWKSANEYSNNSRLILKDLFNKFYCKRLLEFSKKFFKIESAQYMVKLAFYFNKKNKENNIKTLIKSWKTFVNKKKMLRSIFEHMYKCNKIQNMQVLNQILGDNFNTLIKNNKINFHENANNLLGLETSSLKELVLKKFHEMELYESDADILNKIKKKSKLNDKNLLFKNNKAIMCLLPKNLDKDDSKKHNKSVRIRNNPKKSDLIESKSYSFKKSDTSKTSLMEIEKLSKICVERMINDSNRSKSNINSNIKISYFDKNINLTCDKMRQNENENLRFLNENESIKTNKDGKNYLLKVKKFAEIKDNDDLQIKNNKIQSESSIKSITFKNYEDNTD